jgi:hypothetical protein
MTEQRFFEKALTAKQRKMSERLSHLTADERMEDADFSRLDESKPMTALNVLMFSQLIEDQRAF